MDLLNSVLIVFLCLGIVAEATSNEIDVQNTVKDFNTEFKGELESFGQELTSDSVPHHTSEAVKEYIEFNEPTDEHVATEQKGLRRSDVPVVITEKVEIVENTTVNATEDSPSNATFISCIVGREDGGKPVELVNSTRLMSLLVSDGNITHRRMPAECVLLLFYARHCPFSSLAAPHFNALPRAFPDLKIVAIDAMKYHSFNTQYGIVGVPTVMLFHNGRPAAKFNDSDYTLEMLGRFISKYTGLEPKNKLFVMSADFGGPVPSVPVKETDHCLVLSCIFIVLCAVYYFSKSTWWQWIVEAVQNTWREAEAHHEHTD